MFGEDVLPESGSELVTGLTNLDVDWADKRPISWGEREEKECETERTDFTHVLKWERGYACGGYQTTWQRYRWKKGR